MRTTLLWNRTVYACSASAINALGPTSAANDWFDGTLLEADYRSASLTLMNATTGAPERNLASADSPQVVVFDPVTSEYLVTTWVSSRLLAYSGSSGQLLANVSGPPLIESIAVDNSTGELYMAGNGLQVVDPRSYAVATSLRTNDSFWGAAYDPINHRVYAADADGTVRVLDTSNNSFVATIRVGGFPSRLVCDPATARLFVPNYRGYVTVINTTSDAVAANTSFGGTLQEAAWDPGSGRVFVSAQLSPGLAVLNGSTGALLGNVTLSGSIFGIEYDRSGNRLVASEFNANLVELLNGTTERVTARVAIGTEPTGLAVDPRTGTALVTSSAPPSFWTVNSTTGAASGATAVNGSIGSPAFDPRNGRFYLPLQENGSLVAVEAYNGTVMDQAYLGGYPSAVAYDLATDTLWVACRTVRSVLELNATTLHVLRLVAVGPTPSAIIDDPAAGELVVVNQVSANLSIINASTGAVVANPNVQFLPTALALDPSHHELFVAQQNGIVEVLNDSTFQEVGTVSAGNQPAAIAYDAASGNVYVANGAGSNLSILRGPGPVSVGEVSVGSGPDALAVSPSGELLVANSFSGSVMTVSVPTTPYAVTFHETGLTPGARWSVWFDGLTENGSGADIVFDAENGSHPYRVTVPRGEVASPSGGRALVAGGAVLVPISVRGPPVHYAVTFRAENLTPGTEWAVRFNDTNLSSVGSTIVFFVLPGNYSFTVGRIAGWSSNATAGWVNVTTANATRSLVFNATAKIQPPGCCSTSPRGNNSSAAGWLGISLLTWAAIGSVVAVGGVVAAIALHRRPRPPGQQPGS